MGIIINEWDKAAEQYAVDQENSTFVEGTKRIVKKRFQDLRGKKVLDLGCGYGVYSEYFRTIGADVVGIDGSVVMINMAKNKYPNNKYVVCDFENRLPFDNNEFDIVFCNQVLMDIENISFLMSESRRILKDNGIFWMGIVHPAFYDGVWQIDGNGFKHSKAISRYISEYSKTNMFWGETTHFHRPLSSYLNTFSDNGFMLKHTEEPISYDGIKKTDDLPLFFFAEFVKVVC